KLPFLCLLSEDSLYPIEINAVKTSKVLYFGNRENDNGYNFDDGLCVIIENKTFSNNRKENYLSYLTTENYEEAFKSHNFEVKRDLKNASSAQIWHYLQNLAADETLKSRTAFVLIIISNSATKDNVNIIYGSDNNCFSVNELKMLFSDDKCEALKGKLKLFIIDGPRGGN
ncbi:caspase-3-like protein, partial [Leptotrombidium deliense]